MRLPIFTQAILARRSDAPRIARVLIAAAAISLGFSFVPQGPALAATAFRIPAPLLPPAEAGGRDEAPPIPVNPLLKSNYDGSAREVLARSRVGDLNEEDLLLFLLLTEYKQPALVDDWRKADSAAEKTRLQMDLIEQIQDYSSRMSLAQSSGAGGALTEFERLLHRAMTYPAYEFVWIHRLIKTRVQVSDGDLRLHYRNNPGDFITPRRAETRYIFRAAPEGGAGDARIAEEKLLHELKRRAEANPEEFADLAREFSQAPSAADGGLAPPFAEGEYFKAFEDAAFSLYPGMISDIVRGPQGLYLIQLLNIELPRPIPFEEAKDGLRDKIAIAHLQKQFQYEVNTLRNRGIIEARSSDWDHLLDTDRFVRVGPMKITKGDFWRLYPEVISPSGAPNANALNWRMLRFIEYELIREDVEARGWNQDARIQRAEAMAASLIRARRAEKQYFEQNWSPAALDISEEGLEPDPAEFPPRVRLFRVWGEIEDPRRYDATTLALMREALPRTLQAYVERSMAEPDKAVAATGPGEVPPAVREVKDLGPRYYTFSWSDLGYVDLSGAPELRDLLRGVEVAQFSPAQWDGSSATSYYVAARSRLTPEERLTLQTRRRRDLAAREEARLRAILRDATAQSLNIEYLFAPLEWKK